MKKTTDKTFVLTFNFGKILTDNIVLTCGLKSIVSVGIRIKFEIGGAFISNFLRTLFSN
jgi:hypothetical protein